VSLAGLLYKEIRKSAALEAELAGYTKNAPELIAAIKDWMAAFETGSGNSSPGTGSRARSGTSRSLPLPRSGRRPSK
jgi:hypothetical protein